MAKIKQNLYYLAAKAFDIMYGDINIKKYNKVTYLGCILDNTLSGESMTLYVINKVNDA